MSALINLRKQREASRARKENAIGLAMMLACVYVGFILGRW